MTFTVGDLNDAVENDKVIARYTRWKTKEEVIKTFTNGALWDYFDEYRKVEFEGIGIAEMVEQEGGEGEGDHAHIIFKIGDRHFMKTGYYSSMDGFYWDDGSLFEVEPYEATVIKYRKVK